MTIKVHTVTASHLQRMHTSGATVNKHLSSSAQAALVVVASVVFTAILCTALAWFATFCFSRGNVVSRTPVERQSYASFTGARVAVFQTLSSCFILLALAQVLCTQQRIRGLAYSPSLAACVWRLIKRTWHVCVATIGLMVLVIRLVSLLPRSMRHLKLEFYLNCPASLLFICFADLATRDIIRQEVQEVRRASTLGSVLSPAIACSRPSHPCTRYWRLYCTTFSMTGFIQLAGLYIHISKRFHVADSSLYLLIFTCASTLLKICTQELTKRLAIRKVRDIRVMCVAVGLPTVVIDTQIRLVLQRIHSNQSTIAGTLFMAGIEVAMRVAKTWLVKLEIRRHERAVCVRSDQVTVAPLVSAVTSLPTADRAPTDPLELARWKRKVWALYVAEVYADMAAEYIAIGCSASILFFYSAHPKFNLATGVALSPTEQLTKIAIQVSTELAVDGFACTLEIWRGTNFQELRKHIAFVVVFFLYLAIVNIEVSSAIYVLD